MAEVPHLTKARELREVADNRSPYGATNQNKVRGSLSRAQGARFEQQIEIACEVYRRVGLADIQKTPEPVKPLRPMGDGRFLAVYTAKAQADFKGTLRGGRSILFEAKSTSTERMEQSRVTAQQSDQLERAYRLGAEVFILCQFCGNGVYRVPWSFWREMKAKAGRKYITAADVKEFEIEVNRNGILAFLG